MSFAVISRTPSSNPTQSAISAATISASSGVTHGCAVNASGRAGIAIIGSPTAGRAAGSALAAGLAFPRARIAPAATGGLVMAVPAVEDVVSTPSDEGVVAALAGDDLVVTGAADHVAVPTP